MSIDATIVGVTYLPGGDARLTLEQPGRSRVAGQQAFIVVDAPPGLEHIIGEHVWGGCSSLMIGETEVAQRIGYTRLRWGKRESWLLKIYSAMRHGA